MSNLLTINVNQQLIVNNLSLYIYPTHEEIHLLLNSIKTLRARNNARTYPLHRYSRLRRNRTETKFFRANGIFLNFANDQVEVYVPKNNPDWLATTTFSPDDVIKITGTVTNLHDNKLTVFIES